MCLIDDLIERCSQMGWQLIADGGGYELLGNGAPASFRSEESVRVWLDKQRQASAPAARGVPGGDARSSAPAASTDQAAVSAGPELPADRRERGHAVWHAQRHDRARAPDRPLAERASEGAMTGDQLPLLSHGLSPLQLGSRVRVVAECWEGVVAQIWPGHDHYAVYSVPWRGPMGKGLPIYGRDELEALGRLDDEAERVAVARVWRPELLEGGL